MKILFIIGDIFFSEPMGVMILSSICKQKGHITKMITIKKHNLLKELKFFDPDLIAYSTMSPEISLFENADIIVKYWMNNKKGKIYRIMGGPHPTFFPEVLNNLKLDAICIGDGENAIIQIIDKIKNNKKIENIKNVISYNNNIENVEKEIFQDLNKWPYIDRDIYYDAFPLFKKLAMRGFITSRGCPYNCTYCHNHAFNKMFKECGKIIRRKSFEYIIDEIKYTIKKYPPVNLIKFSDDTFAHKIDQWLINFLQRYKKEISLPFYCLMRSNTLTEDMAKLLAESGCISIGMSVESGNERIRNEILGRKLSDDVIINSYNYANKYGIKTYGNTLLGIPGAEFIDDFKSFLFTKKLKMVAPTFGVFNPYPKTELSEFAIKNGYLDEKYNYTHKFGYLSPLNNYSKKEKDMQINIAYLGTIFCDLPDCFIPFFRMIIKIKSNIIFKFIGSVYLIFKMGRYIFPHIYPKRLSYFFGIFIESIKLFIPKKIKKLSV